MQVQKIRVLEMLPKAKSVFFSNADINQILKKCEVKAGAAGAAAAAAAAAAAGAAAAAAADVIGILIV